MPIRVGSCAIIVYVRTDETYRVVVVGARKTDFATYRGETQIFTLKIKGDRSGTTKIQINYAPLGVNTSLSRQQWWILHSSADISRPCTYHAAARKRSCNFDTSVPTIFHTHTHTERVHSIYLCRNFPLVVLGDFGVIIILSYESCAQCTPSGSNVLRGKR